MENKKKKLKQIVIGAITLAGLASVVIFGDYSAKYKIQKRDIYEKYPGIESVIYTEFGYEKDKDSGRYNQAIPQIFVFSESNELILNRIQSPSQVVQVETGLENNTEGLKPGDYTLAKQIKYEEINPKIKEYLPVPNKPSS